MFVLQKANKTLIFPDLGYHLTFRIESTNHKLLLSFTSKLVFDFLYVLSKTLLYMYVKIARNMYILLFLVSNYVLLEQTKVR